jgi:hypothetical protein
MVVLVVTCSVSVQQRGVFYIWYICSSKHFSLLLCSYMALFVRVCVMMGVEIYIFIFDTSYMVVIIGMYGLYVEVELYVCVDTSFMVVWVCVASISGGQLPGVCQHMSIVLCCCVWAWMGVQYQSNKEVYYTYTVYVVVSTCLLFCVVICRYSCACVCVHIHIYVC